ncbi:hypothetical protein QJ856_gp0052 [Tupanvirus deep ocean]|uniref:Uncharacterized protein n=2 Tax=Tupanvirus TaxID=2094720 RepID=A0AC62A792_9VIRU|nr:hypothetical protein QJ856_gp0052 [Tupanvirus deep ocean]QKU33468.1 hypothetical protein [Tupanvirus deep ocean]
MEIHVECPNCGDMVQIFRINCGIFRHGVLKKNKQQIPPHADEKYCKKLIKRDLIYGCGKPFKLVHENGELKAIKCGYI